MSDGYNPRLSGKIKSEPIKHMGDLTQYILSMPLYGKALDKGRGPTTKGGNGVDTGILGLASDEVKIEVRDEEVVPDMYEFIPVEKEPYIDIKDLQRRVEYPEIARRANVQGKVLVRVLVGKNGVPVKSIVESSDSDLLDSAATRAIMKSVFTPALQNSQPVTCWVSIPVVFLMR
jgi:TonB family protein